jgi:hypothetical protein
MEAVMNIPRFVLATALLLPLTSADAGWQDFLKSLTGNTSEAPTQPGNTAALSNREIAAGLRQALALGAQRAIAILGRRGGYLDDPQVHIPLPGMLATTADALRMMGQGQLVDDFETTVNRAAERAIPKTLHIIKVTVRNMTLQDVRGILNGPDDSATRFLRNKAGARLHKAIRPIVAEATDASGATAAYKRLAGQASSSLGGMVQAEELDLDGYVTDKALDGLYLKLAEEERRIRRDPVARTTDLLKKVFGS